ncbi:MAG: rhodanese-like domain-containing protein, partial [Hydrococcus sp. Prado102]|nr:rhodanese-like domain-containing protein [Hydrococcus sp. Prado102]
MKKNQWLVSPEWLSQQLDDSQVAIVDCRFQLADPQWGYRQYLASHIQGAYYLDLEKDLSAPVKKHGGRHPLPDPQLLAQKLTNL